VHSENAARCEICHAPYALAADPCSLVRFHARLALWGLNFALWGSGLAWAVANLLVTSPAICEAYGLQPGELSLPEQLLVGWAAIFAVVGAIGMLALLARLAGLVLVLVLVFFNEIGDMLTQAACSRPVVGVTAVVGVFVVLSMTSYHIRKACRGRQRNLRVVDLDEQRRERANSASA
jgi:hypothetical protein